MSRNKFSVASRPVVRYNRSKFDLSHGHKTTLNVGDLIPFDVQEVYPGDSFRVKSTFVARLTSTFLKPVMDNLMLDVFYFFVPNRLMFSKWAEVMGENKTNAWAPRTETNCPRVLCNGVVSGSLADYFGIPPESNGTSLWVSDMPFRGYALIWNEWFRNENTNDPVFVAVDSNAASTCNSNPFGPTNYHGMPAKVTRLPDYFSTCLPAPQKGNAAAVPITSVNNRIPVTTGADNGKEQIGMRMGTFTKSIPSSGGSPLFNGPLGLQTSKQLVMATSPDSAVENSTVYPAPINLGVNKSDLALNVTVNDLRLAFQTQKLLEKSARGGSRYTEYLLSNFGVSSPDSRLQRPEYLGGTRIPIGVQQVAQTSAGTEESPQANLSAFSLSNGGARYSKGFVEHGLVFGLCVIRQKHTYQQGIERYLSRYRRLDFYDPVFANIGEQPVYMSEIYAKGNVFPDGSNDPAVFGYQEAWTDLRMRPSQISGALRTGSGGFDIWHFADYYSSQPSLDGSKSIMDEIPDFVDRAISVPHTTAPQFLLDVWNDVTAIRVMPTYSTPGLIDHH